MYKFKHDRSILASYQTHSVNQILEPVDRESLITDDFQVRFVMMNMNQRLRVWRNTKASDVKYKLWLALDVNYDIIK